MTLLDSRRFVLLLASALVFGTFHASDASAQDGDRAAMAPRLHLRGMLGFGGHGKLEVDGDSVDDDLQLGYGGAAEIEFPLSRYFTLGGGVTALAWQADLEDDDTTRNVVTDFDVVPRLRVPFGSNGPHGQVHVGVPVGLAANFPSDDYADAVQNVGGELSNGVGLHVGARLGAEVFFTRHFGLVGEIGYDYRALRHRIEGPLGGDEKFTLNLTNFSAQLGFVIAL